MVILRYVGKVNALGDPTFLMGVPARDLTEADIEERNLDVKVLVKSGLYEKVENPKEEPPKPGWELKKRQGG